MARIVIHVGPGKCGSTSIQSELRMRQKDFGASISFLMLTPTMIRNLDTKNPDEEHIKNFEHIISEILKKADILIISNEFLFLARNALYLICKISQKFVTNIKILGYSRRQSDFVQSSYYQWQFRITERSKASCQTLISMGLDPMLFSGLERHLIALIEESDKVRLNQSRALIPNWHNGYRDIEARLSKLDVEVEVIAGHIPTSDFNFSLLRDFYNKCGISVDRDWDIDTKRNANPQFDKNLIEAFATATMLGLIQIDRHHHNDYFQKMSFFAAESQKIHENTFLSDLKSYLDTICLLDNKKFAQKFDIPIECFSPMKNFLKSDVILLCENESKFRIENPKLVFERFSESAAVMAKISFEHFLKVEND
jgi:hypothetical protein